MSPTVDRLLNENSYLRIIVDAVPSTMFIVDDEVRIIDINTAGIERFGVSADLIFKQLCGEVLRCANVVDNEIDCGKGESCKECVIRNSVNHSIGGQRILRKRCSMQRYEANEAVTSDYLVSTSPFNYLNKELVLLCLEENLSV